MKFVKTESAVTISIGDDIEIVSKDDKRFDKVSELLENDASDKKIIWCLYGDVIKRAKEALLKVGNRTI